MKDKICLICHTAIEMDKEFCELKHYEKKDKIKTKGYYHVQCLANRFTGAGTQQVLAQKAMDMINRVNNLMN